MERGKRALDDAKVLYVSGIKYGKVEGWPRALASTTC